MSWRRHGLFIVAWFKPTTLWSAIISIVNHMQIRLIIVTEVYELVKYRSCDQFWFHHHIIERVGGGGGGGGGGGLLCDCIVRFDAGPHTEFSKDLKNNIWWNILGSHIMAHYWAFVNESTNHKQNPSLKGSSADVWRLDCWLLVHAFEHRIELPLVPDTLMHMWGPCEGKRRIWHIFIK